MRAYAIVGPGQPPNLVRLPDPQVGARDVLVAVHAASLNGFDLYQASGFLAAMMEHRFPAVIGRDFAGVVEAVGSEATAFASGDEVLGFVPVAPPLEHGSFADRLCGPDLVLTLKPVGLGFGEAAALPLAGTSALDVLDVLDEVSVGEADTLLVAGASGGVGAFAVQLAASRGVTVIATARPHADAFVRGLGATHTVDYSSRAVADAVREMFPDGITALVDLVNQREGLTDLGSVVHSGGRVASLLGAADTELFAARGVTATNLNANPTADKLARLASLAAAGELRVPVDRTFSLDRAAEAFVAFQNPKRGKIVLQVAASDHG